MDPAPDDRQPGRSATTKVRLPGVGSGTRTAIVLAVTFLLVATLKPWGDFGLPTTASGAPVGGPGSTEPPVLLPPTASDVVAGFCLEPASWRVYVEEQWSGREVRSWIAVEPSSTVSDPLDADIPTVPVMSQLVRAVGWCAPRIARDVTPSPVTVRVWRVTSELDGEPSAAVIAPPRLRPAVESPLGAVYRAPGSIGEDRDEASGWPSGRYVFSIAPMLHTGAAMWFAVEIEVHPRPAP